MSKINYLERPIKPLKIRLVRMITSFDSKANDNKLYPIYDKHTMWPNIPIIIIMPIKRPGAIRVERLKVNIRR